jgi:hypothetical protein
MTISQSTTPSIYFLHEQYQHVRREKKPEIIIMIINTTTNLYKRHGHPARKLADEPNTIKIHSQKKTSGK